MIDKGKYTVEKPTPKVNGKVFLIHMFVQVTYFASKYWSLGDSLDDLE